MRRWVGGDDGGVLMWWGEEEGGVERWAFWKKWFGEVGRLDGAEEDLLWKRKGRWGELGWRGWGRHAVVCAVARNQEL